MKNQLFSMALGLMTCSVFAQTSASFVDIPANQYGQEANFNNCDTVGFGRTNALNYTVLNILLTQTPDKFSLFVVENVRTYPRDTSIYDTLSFQKVSGLGCNFTGYKTQNGKTGCVNNFSTISSDLLIGYTLPIFSSYQQWRNSYVKVHFKVKGDNSLYTVKDTTTRLGFIFKPNLKVDGLLLSSDNFINIKWYKDYYYGTLLYTGLKTIPLLSDGTYCAYEESEYYNAYPGYKTTACTTQTCLAFKAIKDNLGNGTLEVPLINGAKYQWYNQGNPIANATTNKYQAIETGNYSVSVTFDFEQSTSNLRTESVGLVTGLYYYNYTATVTDIESNSIDQKVKNIVRVYTPFGQEIKPEQAIKGLYIYQYNDGSVKKVMKVE